MTDVLDKLAGIMRDVFIAPDLEVTRETTAADVPGWDSLAHVRLILTIEKCFAIKFAPLEARLLKDVGELSHLIEKKLMDYE
jgi:acyl carrier protein